MLIGYWENRIGHEMILKCELTCDVTQKTKTIVWSNIIWLPKQWQEWDLKWGLKTFYIWFIVLGFWMECDFCWASFGGRKPKI